MVRQCAWCLRLIDFAGERVSAQPLPKLYEASHGMCGICGTHWIEQVFSSLAPQAPSLYGSDQGTASIPAGSSSLSCTAGLSMQQQERDGASIVMCESNGSYSSQAAYLSHPEGQEPILEDNSSVADLSQSSQRRQL